MAQAVAGQFVLGETAVGQKSVAEASQLAHRPPPS